MNENYTDCISSEMRPVILEFVGDKKCDVVATAEAITRGKDVPVVPEDAVRDFQGWYNIEPGRRHLIRSLGSAAVSRIKWWFNNPSKQT